MAFRSIPTYTDPYSAVRENRAGLRDVSERRKRDKLQRQQLTAQRKAAQAQQGAALPRYGAPMASGGESVADREQARRGRIREAQAMAGIGRPDATQMQGAQLENQRLQEQARQDQLYTQDMERQNALAMAQEEALAKRYVADSGMYGQLGATAMTADASMYGSQQQAMAAIQAAELQKQSWIESNTIQGEYGVKQAEVEMAGRKSIAEMEAETAMKRLESDERFKLLSFDEQVKVREQVAKIAREDAARKYRLHEQTEFMDTLRYQNERKDIEYEREQAKLAATAEAANAKDQGIIDSRDRSFGYAEKQLSAIDQMMMDLRERYTTSDALDGKKTLNMEALSQDPTYVELYSRKMQLLDSMMGITKGVDGVSDEDLDAMAAQGLFN
jgi:hypothetical protein